MSASFNLIRLGSVAVIELDENQKDIKKLNQKERKLVYNACKVIKTNQNSTPNSSDVQKWEDILIKIRTAHFSPIESKSNSTTYRIRHLFSSIVKSIGNFIGLRISSDKLSKKIHSTALIMFSDNKLYNSYHECLNSLRELTPELCESANINIPYVKETIEAFLLMHVHKKSMNLNSEDDYLNQIYANQQVLEKVGLHIHFNNPIEKMIMHAPELLIDLYQIAKQKKLIKEFFTLAFDPCDACFEARYEKLSEYYAKLTATEGPESLAKATPTEQLIPLIQSEKSKKDNIGFCIESFTDTQAREYAAQNDIQIQQDWEAVKNQIIDEDDFRSQFLNASSYQNFLVEKVKIIEKSASDGNFTLEELPNLINIYVDLGMIEPN